MKRIVLTGGGTAGHVMPNIALLPYLSDYEVHYIGSAGMEKELLKKEKIIYHEIPAVKLIRSLTPKNLLIPFKLCDSVDKAKKTLKDINPAVIFSKGGFVGLPAALGKSKTTPLILHESDMTLGLANKIVKNKCDKLLTSFDCIKGEKVLHTGSAIRQNIYRGNRLKAESECGFSRNNKPYLLIFGGSLGAKRISEQVFAEIDALCLKYNVIHVVGKGNKTDLKRQGYLQVEFLPNIEDYFALADFVVSRGGANSLFELIALQKPTLCIPLSKNSSRGDQLDNAEYFRKRGCIEVLQEQEMSQVSLTAALNKLERNQKSLRENMRKLSPVIDGTEKIAEIIISYADKQR